MHTQIEHYKLVIIVITGFIISARQHICYSALFANARPSVCPAVCHTGGSVKDGS